MWTNLLGSINTFFILFSLLGVCSQLRTIWSRKRQQQANVTAVLSQKMFFISFLAYFSFFVYGMAIQPFNHFIVWPRLIASVVMACILYELWLDRKDRPSYFCFVIALGLMALGVVFALSGTHYLDEGKVTMAGLIVCISIILAQGYWHQIRLVYKAGATGALDKKMSLFILYMDISTLAFALSLGVKDAWPLMLLATVSGITKIIVLYLFRWVRISPSAAQKRMLNHGV